MARFSKSFLLTISIPLIYFLLLSISVLAFELSICALLVYGVALMSYSAYKKYILVLFWFPILISVFQNVFFGILVKYFNENELKVLLVYNYVIVVIILTLFILSNLLKGKLKFLALLLFSITAYSILLIFTTNSNLLSVFASFRNVTSIFIFCYFGWELARLNEPNKENLEGGVLKYVIVIIFIFGVIDQFFINDLWKFLNIEEVWNKKGLGETIRPNGLPGNFYASERWNDNYIRRMVSSFADPVNLGTSLFLLFILSWYFRKYVLSFLSLVMIFLTVSKGAILGLMCFILFFFRNKFGKITYAVTIPFAFLLGFAFLYWAYLNNAGSVFAHLFGFANSISVVINNPLGLGLGNVGVVAKGFSAALNSEIAESGLGLIIGQLGIPGLLLFSSLFLFLLKRGFSPYNSYRSQIVFRSLMISILLNITFNEVALSPNSSAGYMIFLGMYSRVWHRKEQLENKKL